MKTFRERLKEGAFGSVQIISAFVFVVIAGLIVIFAAAEKKNEPFNAAVAALGAVGQVAIAWLVYRLSERQFKHSQTSNERQYKVDSYADRSKAIDDFQAWWKDIGPRLGDTDLDELLAHMTKLKSLFGKPIHIKIDNFVDKFIRNLVTSNEIRLAEVSGVDKAVIMPSRAKLISSYGPMMLSHGLLLNAMRNEMSIEAPVV